MPEAYKKAFIDLVLLLLKEEAPREFSKGSFYGFSISCCCDN